MKLNKDILVAAGWSLLAVFIGVLILILSAANVGCHGIHPPAVPATLPYNPVHHPFAAMTDSLNEIDSLMGVVYALSVAVFGVGVILMFYLKTSLGPAMMAGGVATIILTLFVKSLLWFVPWIAGGVILLGAIAFAIDVRKRGFLAALHDVEELVHPDSK